MMRHVAMVGLLVAVAGCAQPTPYAAKAHDQGYSETQIDANRWRVTFRGNSVTPKQTVEDYLLYRAAELTAAHGYDYFVVAAREREPKTLYSNDAIGFPGYGGLYPFYLGGPVVGAPPPIPITRYEETAEIVMFKGTKPAAEAQAYAARDILARLGPEIRRPDRAAG